MEGGKPRSFPQGGGDWGKGPQSLKSRPAMASGRIPSVSRTGFRGSRNDSRDDDPLDEVKLGTSRLDATMREVGLGIGG